MIKSVKVLGINVPIVEQTFREFPEMLNAYGYFDAQHERIILASHNNHDRKRECTLHEILHALEKATETPLEEAQVGRIARGLFAVLRDNPEYVAWLMETEESGG